MGGCMAEITDVETDGCSTRTIAVESDDASAVIAAVRSIGLDGYANTSYPRALAALIDAGPLRYAVLDVGTNSVKLGARRRIIRLPSRGGRWMGSADEAVVLAFTAAINRRDLPGLGRLMADDHRFIDTAGDTVAGKPACLEAWRGFFKSFPDYRNVFDNVRSTSDGIVEVHGRSECSVAALAGPARWRAVVADGLVVEWQVFDAHEWPRIKKGRAQNRPGLSSSTDPASR
jgi:hypothetical protein